MTTKFAIVDCGCLVTGTISPQGVDISNDGGTGAAEILRGARNFSDPDRLAASLLNRWVTGGAGYDGGWAAARENRLYVLVNDGAGRAYA